MKNYKENIYESPIKTSAGSVHFSGQTDNYFGHTRIEDMADNKTRRVIEVQSDLFQKGNLEREMPAIAKSKTEMDATRSLSEKDRLAGDGYNENAKQLERVKEIEKLQQYNNPTAHFRMVREEVKKAAEDGKSRVLIPTGKTAMEIEGLAPRKNSWMRQAESGIDPILGAEAPAGAMEKLLPNELAVGMNVRGSGMDWIVTDVLGDGKFKAIPKGFKDMWESGINADGRPITDWRGIKEQFDISGKVDENNPIYKFYEKELGRYVKNKYSATPFTDDKGVTWYEIKIKPEYATESVEAFGKARINPLIGGAAVTGLVSLGAKAAQNKRD